MPKILKRDPRRSLRPLAKQKFAKFLKEITLSENDFSSDNDDFLLETSDSESNSSDVNMKTSQNVGISENIIIDVDQIDQATYMKPEDCNDILGLEMQQNAFPIIDLLDETAANNKLQSNEMLDIKVNDVEDIGNKEQVAITGGVDISAYPIINLMEETANIKAELNKIVNLKTVGIGDIGNEEQVAVATNNKWSALEIKIDNIMNVVNSNTIQLIALREDVNEVLRMGYFTKNLLPTYHLLPKFPLKTPEMFEEFELNCTTNVDVAQQFKQRIACIGGRNMGSYVRRILGSVIYDHAAIPYSWFGLQNKKSVRSYTIMKLIIDVTSNLFNTTTADIEKIITTWFHHTKDRSKRGQVINNSDSS